MTKPPMSPSEHGPEIAHIPQELETHVGSLPLGAGIREPISAIERPIDPVIANTMKSAWWSSLRNQIAEFSLDPEAAHNVSVAARHSVDFDYQGTPTGQGFTVFEVGELEEDREAINTAIRTLELIDQWSGGLLAGSPNRLNVVLANGFRLHSRRYKNNDGTPRENNGLNFENTILISMPYLRDLATEYPGMDFHNLLATTIVHEALGHRVENTLERRSGDYFGRHFQYSDQGPGTAYPQVFRSITSKEGIADTHPVREYGSTLPEEDVATSVDAVVAAAMGWELTNRNSPRFANTPDAYRDELVMRLLDKGAEVAKKRGYAGVPGYVGNEVYYDANGRPQPARTASVASAYARHTVGEGA